ncbi:MAG: hypothetical protein ACYTBZ_07840 [Planctomycetota bacterium]
MYKRIIEYKWPICAFGLVLLTATAIQVYAHCGKCSIDGQAQAVELNKCKMTLAAAATLAEVNTKGTAVRATIHKHQKGLFAEVHCMVGGKIMAVEVDCQNGKINKATEVADLEAHATPSELGEISAASPTAEKSIIKPTATDPEAIKKAQPLLDKVNSSIKDGNLGQAQESLTSLEGMKSSLPKSMQQQISSARTAYDAAKAAQAIKSKVPSGF